MRQTREATVYSFNGVEDGVPLDMPQAFESIACSERVAVQFDLLNAQELEHWWGDDGFPRTPERGHNHAPLTIASPTLGPLQRASEEDYSAKLASYFAYAKLANRDLRRTRFVRLFIDELGAEAYQIGEWGELLMATRRLFLENRDTEYSFEPHVDAINFGVNPGTWLIKKDYEQISALLTISGASNHAGIVFWDKRPKHRVELNSWIKEYRETGRIRAIEHVATFTATPSAGQLLLFSSRYLHAVEACLSQRRTLGTFLVWEEGWRLCH
ncbi:MAG: hypothetical protein HKM95_15545 [Inquilinus sp.]|nr:hypothetical protein [Inquilinus sp.]